MVPPEVVNICRPFSWTKPVQGEQVIRGDCPLVLPLPVGHLAGVIGVETCGQLCRAGAHALEVEQAARASVALPPCPVTWLPRGVPRRSAKPPEAPVPPARVLG